MAKGDDKTIDKFRALLIIDKHNLDEEIQLQPERYFEVSEEAALAISIKDFKYELIKRAHSSLSKHIREQAAINDEKLTEAGVEAEIKSHKTYQNAFSAWLQASKRAAILVALEESFKQRSYMMRELVNLHNSGYYTSSTIRSKAFKSSSEAEYDAIKKKRKKDRKIKPLLKKTKSKKTKKEKSK